MLHQASSRSGRCCGNQAGLKGGEQAKRWCVAGGCDRQVGEEGDAKEDDWVLQL